MLGSAFKSSALKHFSEESACFLSVFQSALLTGIVCPPCRLLMAACASPWLENLTKAQPVHTESRRDRREGNVVSEMV